MTFILPPPMWVAEELLKVDLASFLRSATATTLDRKTLVKVTLGQAAARTLARLADHFRRRHPKLAGYQDTIRGRRAEELAAQGRLEDFEVEEATSTWRAGIEAAAMAAIEAGEPQFVLTVLHERLLPLEDASMRAEVLFRKGAFTEVLDLLEETALGPFLDVARLRQETDGCNDPEAFRDAFKPVRALACLYVLALFERQFYSTGDNPGFESILPRLEGGALVLPMSRLVKQLEQTMPARSRSASRRQMFSRDKAEDHSIQRRVRRWVLEGRFPEEQSFVTLVNSVGADRGFPPPDRRIVKAHYNGLRYLTTLGEMLKDSPAPAHFGGFNEFFECYHAIKASLR